MYNTVKYSKSTQYTVTLIIYSIMHPFVFNDSMSGVCVCQVSHTPPPPNPQQCRLHWPNIVSKLVHRHRRWTNIDTTFGSMTCVSGALRGGGGPRVVVSTAALHARVRSSVLNLGGLKETKNVSFPSTCESQYCGEPPWPRGSVLGLRPPVLEFLILCLEDSVISIISPSSGGSPGPV